MALNLRHRNFLKELDFSAEEFRYLVSLGAELKLAKRSGHEVPRLTGRNIALVFQKTSTRTRAAFEVAAHDQGAHVTFFGPDESQIGTKESIKDTARVLGRMFDGIEFRGFAQDDLELLGRHAGVPVWNGLTDEWHPTQMLADVLTMTEHSEKQLPDIRCCYLGDARNNTARSLLVTGALLGMDIRVASPAELWPDGGLRSTAAKIAESSGARVKVTEDVAAAVEAADFVYTDIWLSMGEPEKEWERRIELLRPYQVNEAVLDLTGNPQVKFMHCLPALHDRNTTISQTLFERTGLDALEVTDEVFESSGSIVFDQAENRMHTVKALMVATLGA
jgi:ornithine carbamoyltransferase